jgi:hypothetical protein
MTHIITAVLKDSILMASDTRLNYHDVIEKNGFKYQVIKLTADCTRKTFYLKKAKLGIQFIGIGYLKEGASKYHLSHFLPKLETGIKNKQGIKLKIKIILNNLREITTQGDDGNYVNGIISGFENNNMYIATFNTFNSEDPLEIINVKEGVFVDSENKIQGIDKKEQLVINQIYDAINYSSKNKPESIGNDIEILKITKNSAKYIKQGSNLFYGNQEELFELMRNNISKINGKILNPPVIQKIDL